MKLPNHLKLTQDHGGCSYSKLGVALFPQLFFACQRAYFWAIYAHFQIDFWDKATLIGFVDSSASQTVQFTSQHVVMPSEYALINTLLRREKVKELSFIMAYNQGNFNATCVWLRFFPAHVQKQLPRSNGYRPVMFTKSGEWMPMFIWHISLQSRSQGWQKETFS